jgi:hypothetical protein
MARGWESKDVQAQLEEKKDVPQTLDNKSQKSSDQILREQERRGLQLSRTRILKDLETATHPNHRKSLEAALAHLDRKIADLN